MVEAGASMVQGPVLEMPASHHLIQYGALAVVIWMIIGFIIQFKRGVLGLSQLREIYPFMGPIGHESKASALIKSIIEVALYPFYGAPFNKCHTQALYVKKPHAKRTAHLLIWWGFVLTGLATFISTFITVFVEDSWPLYSKFVLGGSWQGAALIVALGTIGGIFLIIGFILMFVNRFRGEYNKTLVSTDLFLILILGTALTGFFTQVTLWLNAPYEVKAVAFWSHMLFVILLFALMPFTKFAHAIIVPIWLIYDRYLARIGKEPKLLGPWSGELAEKALHSMVPSHKPKTQSKH